ncbi:MAG: LysM peptidoglycan-binding domain-containing protein [Dehalococcoidia bacterium]
MPTTSVSAPARPWIIPAVALLGIAALVGACGDGSETPTTAGPLTDPRSVPTSTPWPEAEEPEPVFLEEDSVGPISGGEDTEVTPGECGETYVVQSGDNPSIIAELCGVDVDELLELNGITDPTSLHVGDELSIP